jgi:hypothetical protein
MPEVWPDIAAHTRVIGNERAEGDCRGRKGLTLEDNSESQFGHKHVRVLWDDGAQSVIRTIHLDQDE